MTVLPPWYRIALEEQARCVAERAEGEHPRILEYLRTCSDLEEGEWDRDSTPWCAAFVNWCFERCGIAGTGSGWAQSFAVWGEPLEAPRPGAVAVWSRGPAEGDAPVVTGHVAFVVGDQGDDLLVLGGNQSDCVCTKTYPKHGFVTDTVASAAPARELYALIGYRWPVRA